MADNNFRISHTLTDEISDILRERILSGEYGIGEKIKEAAVADELKVSRTPIREAFKNLQKEGLIEYIPNRGCFARGFTKRDIDDIYDIRKALEILTIKWAIEGISDKEIDELKKQCQMMRNYASKHENQKALKVNPVFHDVIYRAAGSRFMTRVLHSYKDYITDTREAIFYDDEYLAQVIEEHEAILKAIEKRDVEMATAAMADHLDRSKKRASALYLKAE